MKLTLEFDRVWLKDSELIWDQLKENEAVIGEVNGKMCILQMITEEQWEDIRRQAKENHQKKKSLETKE